MVRNLRRWAHGWGWGLGRGRGIGVTNIDWVYVSIVVGVHVAIWKEPIGEKREQDKFRKRQQFVS